MSSQATTSKQVASQMNDVAKPKNKRWQLLRIKDARLCYRWNEQDDWTHLQESYEEILDVGKSSKKDTMKEPPNVENASLSGQAISVRQYGGKYNRSNQTKREEDWLCYRADFEISKIADMKINEGSRKESKVVYSEIRFRCLEPPKGFDDTQKKTVEDEEEAEEGQVEEGEVAGEEVEEGGMDIDDPQPSDFPLAKLVNETAENAEILEIRLTFVHTKSGPGSPFKWDWRAATWFLAGRGDWWFTGDIKDYDAINSKGLDKWLSSVESSAPVSWARFKRNRGPHDNAEWVLDPKSDTTKVSELPAPPKQAKEALQAQNDEPSLGKRKERDDEGKTRDADAVIASLQMAMLARDEAMKVYQEKINEVDALTKELMHLSVKRPRTEP